ncbi:preprotein translocase subunit SecE [candidate division WOR-1 bacterium RIFOXYA12_FULL_43_27]|uniref:Protein translocase subunit SecE n=1 Tax=candidate division WOR-1 bacterium RIFOXYC2_FULL_46_14 TaxID=1802587 RepID=A0A1F4U5U5_UNCSA|nr:MAG: preprotein translocase subunit SecE [candidate division WOR-1 bacterium RIFOXYA12_FULL_43_27]OGC20457.1 MAG: preprotein translocase subunit SecE [candidate division WOR-1 bacterium RIFOXYB2_FULL_46_45]OGC31806.1 MAG: preprotein translocase subunit SecE [candidate division WOR-1 bacterium RIFOXYA2_FULL_46_56]OGC40302.1 MAG: preprotein translocase subunit SecE [candidate division WOR-1 bacterium RIFOXYC2_FULL_46_14]
MKNKITEYLKETQAEVKKVAWPTRQYVVSATIIIIVVSFAIGFFVMFTDLVLAKLILLLNQVF